MKGKTFFFDLLIATVTLKDLYSKEVTFSFTYNHKPGT